MSTGETTSREPKPRRSDIENEISARFNRVTSISPGYWVADNFERTSISYTSTGHNSHSAVDAESYWFEHRNAIFLQAARRHGATDILVDIGGGIGTVAKSFIANGHDAMVVEPLPEGAAISRSRGLMVVEAALRDAAPSPQAFGLMGMFDVLEHIDDEADALSTVAQALEPGGIFLVAVPAHRWLWSRYDNDGGHFRRYTNESLTAGLNNAGLEVAEMTHLFSFLVPPVFFLRSIPSAFGAFGSNSGAVADEVVESKSAHKPPSVVASGVRAICRWEARQVAAGRMIPIGTSLFAVARKPWP